jgi:hypothetical protein
MLAVPDAIVQVQLLVWIFMMRVVMVIASGKRINTSSSQCFVSTRSCANSMHRCLYRVSHIRQMASAPSVPERISALMLGQQIWEADKIKGLAQSVADDSASGPNLKKLAADSVVYSQAIAPADMTLTSHASLFTGLYPTWHGAYCQPPNAAHGRVLSTAIDHVTGT